MDRGEVLLVDLSGVGGDNATLFGAMLASRYYVDAVGRQELAPAARRQHLLLIDEAHRFATRAVENTLVEGRKFGLALGLASQSLGGLGERLSRSVLTNAASIALLAPGSEDVRNLARLFAPVTAEQLTSLRAFEVVMRMPDGVASRRPPAGSSCRRGPATRLWPPRSSPPATPVMPGRSTRSEPRSIGGLAGPRRGARPTRAGPVQR